MKIYMVGGAVRDQLMGLSVKEKDWVVVGSTPEEMRTKKFKQVGKTLSLKNVQPESMKMIQRAKKVYDINIVE